MTAEKHAVLANLEKNMSGNIHMYKMSNIYTVIIVRKQNDV